MFTIFSVTLPIFLLIAAGVLAGRYLGVGRHDMRGLVQFVWFFALPALVFRAFATHKIGDFLHGSYLFVYLAGSLVTFAGSLLFARLVRGKNLTESAVIALGSSASNSGFVGFPLAALVVPPVAPIALALNMIVENLIVMPAGVALAEEGQRGGAGAVRALRDSVRSLVRNPIIIALVAGGLLSASGLDITQMAFFHAIDMLASASGAVALFVVGATLASTKASGLMGDAVQVSIGKLVVHPLAVLAFTLLAPGLDPQLRAAAIIFAASPMFTIFPIIGHRFGLQDASSAALLLATAASFVTISLVLLVI